MTVVVEKCPECESRIATCDNGTRLDYPAVAYDPSPLGACWSIMSIGSLDMACVGPRVNPEGAVQYLGHTLHEHQPPEN